MKINRQIQNTKFQQAFLRVIKNNNKTGKVMTQKNLLISSMQKLINHVRKSQANQQEIFYSLSRNDFKKILSNLQDQNIMLRKTSLNLISQLLATNSKLKKKFCQTMEINLLAGKILFHSKTIQKHIATTNYRNLLILLKKQPDIIQSDCLLWYINTKYPTRQLQVQYIYRDKTKMQMQINIDPQQCIVGFCLSQKDITLQYSTTNLSSLATTQVSQQSKKYQLKNLIQPNPKKVISIVGSKVNSSMSDSQPRYQRNSKTTQPQTDRPKKFMNNFLHQRKLNTSKGAQTQRFNTQNSSILQNESSLDISKQINRSTMPKTTQSPYIPTLNLQTTGATLGYRTDRISQSYTTTNSKAKQMDFQKIKYQGIKITTNTANRSSYGNNIVRNNTDRDHPSTSYTANGFIPNHSYMIGSVGSNQQNNYRRQGQNSFNFKYIKPMTTSNQQGIKFVNFFHKKPQDHSPLMQKKTIDVYQFIKNK